MSDATRQDVYIRRAANLIGIGAGLDDTCKALQEGGATRQEAEQAYQAGKLLAYYREQDRSGHESTD
jgi:hypothetical protein